MADVQTVKAGMIYRGSVALAAGAVVQGAEPCYCPRCYWAGSGRVHALVLTAAGRRLDLDHARPGSFEARKW